MTPGVERLRHSAAKTAPHRRGKRGQRLLLSGLVLLLCLSFTGRCVELFNAQRQVAALRARLTVVEAQNQRLRSQIDFLQSDEYVERVARDELGLVMPGEIQFITIRTSSTTPR